MQYKYGDHWQNRCVLSSVECVQNIEMVQKVFFHLIDYAVLKYHAVYKLKIWSNNNNKIPTRTNKASH